MTCPTLVLSCSVDENGALTFVVVGTYPGCEQRYLEGAVSVLFCGRPYGEKCVFPVN